MPDSIHTDTEARRQAIIDACNAMNRVGINQGTSGNISVRDGDGILITPTSLPYDTMAPDDIVRVSGDGSFVGNHFPSSEWRFHLDIMMARKDVGAIVHAHPIACTTLAIMKKNIPAIHYMIAVCGGSDIRCATYATFGTEELSRNALAALEGRTACLLAHHGMIALGATLDQAMWRAIEVETLARQYLGCLPLGEPPVLSEAEIQNVLRRMGGYGHQD